MTKKIPNNWYHVFPVNDVEAHDLQSFDCKCDPEINYTDMVVVHNAFDKRDVLEEISSNVFGDRVFDDLEDEEYLGGMYE